MSSPNINYIVKEKTRRRSTFQFIKECNELAKSAPAQTDRVSPEYFASVYHQLHSIENLYEFGPPLHEQTHESIATPTANTHSSIPKNNSSIHRSSPPLTSCQKRPFCSSSSSHVNVEKSSFGKNPHMLKDPDMSGHISAMSRLKKSIGTTNVPPLCSNASSGSCLAQCSDQPSSFGRTANCKSSCSLAGKVGHVCDIQHGGLHLKLSYDVEEDCGKNITDDNKSINGDDHDKYGDGTLKDRADTSINGLDTAVGVSVFHLFNDLLTYTRLNLHFNFLLHRRTTIPMISHIHRWPM